VTGSNIVLEKARLPYRKDLSSAARRHLKGAQILYKSTSAGAQPGSAAVAGYLFGLAGELALKQMMRSSGMTELPVEQRRDDPFFAHFPALKGLLATRIHGRRSGELRRFAENRGLFSNWSTEMRYAPTADVAEDWIAKWKASAEELVSLMDAP
jgi:hypothetical protein